MPAYRFQQGDRPLEGYTIQHALGRGGFGEVYFALSDAGREVALKAVQNYEDIELRGISHCMNLKSQHLVMIFDVKKDADGMAWVVMEYVSGANLREILDESPEGIGTEQAIYILRELCKGMSYLHDAGVVHRDLKPHNIFFEDGTVKIGDYSLSKAISASHRSGHTSTVGSVHYMAPEISEGRYDKTVDIYAIGVILFEMLTGRPPYEGESMGEVLMKHLSSQPDVSALPDPFGKVVTKAMQRDPSQRYQTASELMRALSPEDELVYSRPPATLSMIGERAGAARASRALHSSSHVEAFATPVALNDTYEDTDSLPFERPTLANPVSLASFGLWWQPKSGLRLEPDTVPLFNRVAIATAVCFLIVPVGCLGDHGTQWSWSEVSLLAIVVAVYSSFVCWLLLSLLPRHTSRWLALGSRVIAAAPVGILLFLNETVAPSLEFDEYIDVVFGVMMAHFLLDYRCLISADRYPRVGLAKTLLAALIAMFFTSAFEQDGDRIVLAPALAVASAIVIQLLAPHRRPVNQSVRNRSAESLSLSAIEPAKSSNSRQPKDVPC